MVKNPFDKEDAEVAVAEMPSEHVDKSKYYLDRVKEEIRTVGSEIRKTLRDLGISTIHIVKGGYHFIISIGHTASAIVNTLQAGEHTYKKHKAKKATQAHTTSVKDEK